LNDTNPMQEQKTTSQPVTRSSISKDESKSIQVKASVEKKLAEQTIDLNELFPDAEADLNNLFPDDEVKSLLKNIIKNKKDMGLIKERLATENETAEDRGQEKIT
jgi:hypothetical protein